jgi:hypothetical protein
VRLRKCQLAWRVACCLPCLFLIALWAWSYSHRQCLFCVSSNGIYNGVCSDSGIIQLSRQDMLKESGSKYDHLVWAYRSVSGRLLYGDTFCWNHTDAGPVIRVPHWSLALVSAGFIPLSLVPFRFTVRALLLVTALSAVALGLIVWIAG